jgi:thioredoxin 1
MPYWKNMKILKTKKMVTVKKFSAVWCGPCRALAPVMTEIKGQFSNVKFEDYDVDDYNEEVTKYNVTSVPTIIIEKNGEIVERFTGLSSKLAYVNAINEAIK